MVTLSASTVISPVTSRPSMTVPSLVISSEPDLVSVTPAGTPVSPAPGNAPVDGFSVDGEALGVGEGDEFDGEGLGVGDCLGVSDGVGSGVGVGDGVGEGEGDGDGLGEGDGDGETPTVVVISGVADAVTSGVGVADCGA